ncbi:MAG TPA: hypothetical protein VFL91_14000 [Thermomicrobiales bacterium]|nr:hypothetical protein [Thermomicrobiales bacterium]
MELTQDRLVDPVADRIAAAVAARLRGDADEYTRDAAAARNAAGWAVAWLPRDPLAAALAPAPRRAVVRLAPDQLDRAWLRAHELLAERLI